MCGMMSTLSDGWRGDMCGMISTLSDGWRSRCVV